MSSDKFVLPTKSDDSDDDYGPPVAVVTSRKKDKAETCKTCRKVNVSLAICFVETVS